MPTQTPDAAPEVGPRTPDPLVGTLLGGRYRIEGVIAEGGTGRVYRAVQEALGRRVAVKLMHAFASDPKLARDFAERFLREASLAGALQHPNVVTVHDFGTLPDGRCFIVMELLAGQNLAEVMRRGPLHPLDVVDLFGQIVRGLRQAHRAGLVHRDMKPANVMISPGEDGRPIAKVLDFGLVKGGMGEVLALDDADPAAEGEGAGDGAAEPGAELTQVGTFLGTPQYVSPEQAMRGAADARSDLYAVGVMLYRALCGRLPFDVRGSAEAVAAHVNEAVPPMRVRAPGSQVPPALEAVTLRCLEKRPEDRFPDADALLEALIAAREGLTESAPPMATAPTEPTLAPHVPEPAREEPARPGRSVGIAAIGLALTAVLLIGGIAYGLWPASDGSGASGAAVTTAPVAPTPVPPPPADVTFAAADPATVEISAAPREVWLLLSSEPAGAEVALDGEVLGTTPLARRLVVAPGPRTRHFLVRREGYAEEDVEIDLSAEQATADVQLRRVGGKKRAEGSAAGEPRPAAPAPLTAVVADNVRFSGEEAAAAKRFVNGASHSELLGAGIAPRQVAIILEKRPFTDVAALAETPFIGDKTMESILAAARKAP